MNVLHDVFPAFVAVAPEGVFEKVQDLESKPVSEGAYGLKKARIVISDERVLIAMDDPTGPMIVFNEPYETFYKSNVREENSYVITKNGKMLAYKYDPNCGCGSRLRSWNPYRHVYSVKDPQ